MNPVRLIVYMITWVIRKWNWYRWELQHDYMDVQSSERKRMIRISEEW